MRRIYRYHCVRFKYRLDWLLSCLFFFSLHPSQASNHYLPQQRFSSLALFPRPKDSQHAAQAFHPSPGPRPDQHRLRPELLRDPRSLQPGVRQRRVPLLRDLRRPGQRPLLLCVSKLCWVATSRGLPHDVWGYIYYSTRSHAQDPWKIGG
ncbi:hypothetical protein BO86DRAFT_406559 [Aspergillus japonicus CBS 114.51]|uniref:Uncharacterized protein n=2 Tax=Aspergillus TaxID=5052 RepID=A0A2V5H1A5_ASPV1|nr:hypothetical protein BO86DRAFT_406559 [Aspergillus japonicus CBS 114.51]PYI14533.1 hypothetical protein BO99DRAFT_446825 [Aspergillus violaceofuscus CBS 115571]RAH86167.1 hypothetical protein BO86DRAFT_406559 [Aspergillus japonicus CBS 114.51]